MKKLIASVLNFSSLIFDDLILHLLLLLWQNLQESLDSSKNVDDTLSPLFCEGSMDSKKRSKLLEKEMYEQVKIINDLRSLGASLGTIEQEVKRLHELETLVFKGFRRRV